MEASSLVCAYQEIIQRTGKVLGEELGTCKICGQQKLYYWKSGKRDFRIIHRGDPELAKEPFDDIAPIRSTEDAEFFPKLRSEEPLDWNEITTEAEHIFTTGGVTMAEESSSQEPIRQTRNRKKPTGRLTEKKKAELLEIGIKAFAKKYGYRHTGMLTAVYNQLAEEAGIKKPDATAVKPSKSTSKPENGRRRPRKNTSSVDPEEEFSTIRQCIKQIAKHPASGAKRIANYLQEFFSSNGKT